MQNKLREIIKEAIGGIFESGHKQDEIYVYTEELVLKLISFIVKQIEVNPSLVDGGEWGLKKTFECGEEFAEATKISEIILDIDFKKDLKENISAVFQSNKTRLLNNDFYKINININIKINRNIKNYKEKVEDILSHELLHAFKYIKTINIISKTNSLNKAKNYTNKEINHLTVKYPEIKRFMDMIYLSNFSEIEARQQETASQLKRADLKTPKETLEYLLQFQPLSDANKMINYSTEEIKKINENILEEFINIFNNNLKNLSLNNDIKSNKSIFFSYWKNKINDAGIKLRKNIINMVSYKYNLKEGLAFLNADDLLDEIF